MQRCGETSGSAGQPAHKKLEMAMGSVEASSGAEQLCSAGWPAHKKLKTAMGSVEASSSVEQPCSAGRPARKNLEEPCSAEPVSYTHLTLPTIYSV